MPVLIVALGTGQVILTGQIDISVGSRFASAVWPPASSRAWGCRRRWRRGSLPLGTALGRTQRRWWRGVRIPAIVVTLATMVALRALHTGPPGVG
jgi:ribose/xylose/arabinose/galactoside ABC-type transport system permease subunit